MNYIKCTEFLQQLQKPNISLIKAMVPMYVHPCGFYC